MVLSQGFHDLLEIREQTRPNIFDLACTKPPVLTPSQHCLPIKSRVYGADHGEFVGELAECANKRGFVQMARK